MSIERYEEARKLIKRMGEDDFTGPKPESLIAKAESALGLTFPPSYRSFLLEMGCGGVSGVEIFGIIDEDFHQSMVPDGIWLTMEERRSMGLDPHYVIVGEVGDGTYYALDTREVNADGENPVVVLSVDGKHGEKVADSFGAYLFNRLSEIA